MQKSVTYSVTFCGMPETAPPLQLHLPKLVGTSSIAELLSVCSQIKTCASDIEIDCSSVTFIDPFGMTVLVSALESVPSEYKISMIWLSTKIATYLDRMDFFARVNVHGVNIPSGRARNEQSHSLMEITLLRNHDNAEEVADKLANAVVGHMVGRAAKPTDFYAPDTEFLQYSNPIRYSLSELIGNALTHARRHGRHSASVWVASQYYQSNDGGEVHLAVVDDGCGFLATLRHHHEVREKTHGAAIVAALKPRVSCNRDLGVSSSSENQGVGLTTTVKIAMRAGGSVRIVSGDSLFADDSSRRKKRSERVSLLPSSWDGVAISAVLNRNQLPGIQVADLLPEDEVEPTLELPYIDFRFVD